MLEFMRVESFFWCIFAPSLLLFCFLLFPSWSFDFFSFIFKSESNSLIHGPPNHCNTPSLIKKFWCRKNGIGIIFLNKYIYLYFMCVFAYFPSNSPPLHTKWYNYHSFHHFELVTYHIRFGLWPLTSESLTVIKVPQNKE